MKKFNYFFAAGFLLFDRTVRRSRRKGNNRFTGKGATDEQ